MKVLLTGASGFIGTALQELPYEWIPVSEQEMDLRSQSEVDRTVKKTQPDAVVHLAAKTEVAWSFDDYSDVSTVNYTGTVHLAEAVTRYAPDAHFVFASTMETYGRQPKARRPRADGSAPWYPFTEETPQNPCAPYAVAKVAAEKYLRYLQEVAGLRVTVLRQTNTYGRTANDFFVVERIITQMLDGSTVRLGDPKPWRNFLHIDDLVELYKQVLENPAAVGEVFVTGPDNALTIEALADMCADIIGWHGRIEWGTQPARPGEVWYLNSTPEKARRVLGWEPKIGLVEGLARTVEAWK